MRYDAATFALYDEVFAETLGFVKRAGLFGTLGTKFKDFVTGSRRAEQATATLNATEAARARAVQEAAALRARMPSGNFSTFEDAAHSAQQAEMRAGAAEAAAIERQRLAEEAATVAQQGARRNKRLAIGGGVVGATGLTAAGAGIPMAYDKGVDQGQEHQTRTRNLAFGSGIVAGTTAPNIIRGLGGIARSAGRTGLFPEFQGLR
jgi:hypothetical protein